MRSLAAEYPAVPDYRRELAVSHSRVDGLPTTAGNSAEALLELKTGDASGAVANAHRAVGLLEGLPARDGPQWFSLACARATLSAAAGRDGLEPSTALASRLADQAIDDLRRAVAMGYRIPAQYRYEPALARLRGRDDFRLLLLDLAFPADPFAR
jgi:hypothetical protein